MESRINQYMIQILGGLLRKAETATVDYRILIDVIQQATRDWHNFLSYAMSRALRCELIVSTPIALIDHMIREVEESIFVLGLIQTGM